MCRKNKKERKKCDNKNPFFLIPVIIVILTILFVIVYVIVHCFNISTSSETIIFSYVGSSVACIGSIYLGAVSLRQNNNMTALSERQFQLSEKMWKINNIDYLPVIDIVDMQMDCGQWQSDLSFNNVTRMGHSQWSNEIYSSVVYDFDCRVYEKKPVFLNDLRLLLKNDSLSKLRAVEIYKIAVSLYEESMGDSYKSYYIIEDVHIQSDYLKPKGMVIFNIRCFHDNEISFKNVSFNLVLYFKMTTITGYSFYQTASVIISGGKYYPSQIKQIDEEELNPIVEESADVRRPLSRK